MSANGALAGQCKEMADKAARLRRISLLAYVALTESASSAAAIRVLKEWSGDPQLRGEAIALIKRVRAATWGNAYPSANPSGNPSRTPREDLANGSRRSHEGLTNTSLRAQCAPGADESARRADKLAQVNSSGGPPAGQTSESDSDQMSDQTSEQIEREIWDDLCGKQSAKQTGSKPVALCHDDDGSEP